MTWSDSSCEMLLLVKSLYNLLLSCVSGYLWDKKLSHNALLVVIECRRCRACVSWERGMETIGTSLLVILVILPLLLIVMILMVIMIIVILVILHASRSS